MVGHDAPPPDDRAESTAPQETPHPKESEKERREEESAVERQGEVERWYDGVEAAHPHHWPPEACGGPPPYSNEEVEVEAIPLPVQRVCQILHAQRVDAITQLQAMLRYDFFSSCGA